MHFWEQNCAPALLIDITELQLTCVCVCHLQMRATLLLSNWCHSNTAVTPIATHTEVWGVCGCEVCGVCVGVRCVGGCGARNNMASQD